MSGQQNPEGEPSGDLASEMGKLGKNLGDLFRKAWESEERKSLQKEFESGMAEFSKSIDQAVKDFEASPASQRIKEEAVDLNERIRSGEVGAAVKDNLLTVLRKINEEIDKVNQSQPPKQE